MVSSDELVRIFTAEPGIRVVEMVDLARYNALSAEMVSALKSAFAMVGAWANLDVSSLRQAIELENRTQVLGVMTGNMTAAMEAFRAKRAPEWPRF